MQKLSRAPQSHRTALDLNAVAENVLPIAQLNTATGIEVEHDFDPKLPKVWGAEEQLSQIFLNLLINAKQAVSGLAEGKIKIETRPREGRVEFRVHDKKPTKLITRSLCSNILTRYPDANVQGKFKWSNVDNNHPKNCQQHLMLFVLLMVF